MPVDARGKDRSALEVNENVDVATRDRGRHKTRLALSVATAMAMALSLSGLALANERPSTSTHKPSLEGRTGAPSGPLRLEPDQNVPVHTFVLLPSSPRHKVQQHVGPYTLPVARRLITREQLHRPHHDYPAWDLGVPLGTRVVAVRAGVVEEVTHSGNCGKGVIILGTDSYTYTYCHASKVGVRPGDLLRTGDRIMLSGSSGHSTGPHVHLQIESPSGRLLCPQSLVTSWFNGGHAGPATAKSTGCFYLTSPKDRRHHRHHRHHNRAAPQKPRHPRPNPSPSPTPSPTQTPKPSPSPTPRPSPSPSPTPTPLPSPTLP
jgi:murein DD-endopeptidase MepM/ murein hydrolase activator NlpD